jgi:hypothetical protein
VVLCYRIGCGVLFLPGNKHKLIVISCLVFSSLAWSMANYYLKSSVADI